MVAERGFDPRILANVWKEYNFTEQEIQLSCCSLCIFFDFSYMVAEHGSNPQTSVITY